MEKIMDMHVHTSYSDGEYKPNEVIRKAIDKNIGTIAITDHNTLEGVKRINPSLSQEIEIYKGIELSAKTDRGRMHILGYQIDLDDVNLNEKMKELYEISLNTFLSVMNQVEKDFDVLFDRVDIEELIDSKRNLGRPDLARLCNKYGYVKTIDEAFKKYLIPAKEKVRLKNKGIFYPECIDLINKSGGIAVLAHPKSLDLSEKDFLIVLRDLIKCGLLGIEVYHSSHNKEEMEYYHNIALEYGLLESGGSDYHGPFVKPMIELGEGYNNNIKIKKLSLVDYLRERDR